MGPNGRNTVYFQAPEGFVAGGSTAEDTNDGNTPTDTAENEQQGYRNLLEVINAAQARAVADADTAPNFDNEPPPIPEGGDAEPAPTVTQRGNSLVRAQPAANKENNTMTPRRTSTTLARALVEKAKSSIKRAPPRATFEENLLKISR